MTDSLQHRLGHTFARPALLQQALTHPGYSNEHPDDGDHYQRLEFLGDAVIQFVVTAALFQLRPVEREGELSRLRVALTNGLFLGELARELELPAHLRLSAAEQKTGGSPTVAGDAYEAVVGAVFLDAGLSVAQAFIMRTYGDLETRLASLRLDEANPKGRLQERVQPTHGTGALRYETVLSGGPDHAKEYTSTIFLADRVLGTGSGSSKKAAEESAARAALVSKM
ncbi:ribonuclease III [Rariglobus hedericola]|uniref:Ribonuclease 3 n=1 Tax=Rariglobus hedericola TaxID=2597822 RepID=A0A556QQS9_9BACT|nr:ribonuclease III [Rariglobus hedericola]TSJ78998.1 ribonuclease III [Rariglobus hedericola]